MQPTPILELKRVAPGVFVKLEHLSLTGAFADRVARHVFAQPLGQALTIAGDSALALALAPGCVQRGIQLEAYLPEDISIETRQALAAGHVKWVPTPFTEGPTEARVRAPHAFDASKAVALAISEVATEWAEHRPTVAVVPLKLFAGFRQHLKGEVFAAVPSAIADGTWRPHRQHGHGLQAPLGGTALISVSDEEAWAMRAELAKREGLLVSVASAACICAAKSLTARHARVDTLAIETGERSFSLEEQFA